MSTAVSMSGATRCMVFVQSTRKSAPARSSERAARDRIPAVTSQLPSSAGRSSSAKSTLYIAMRAECSPPSRAFTAWLICW